MEPMRVLDGKTYAALLRAGATNLRMHAQDINDLNVFPIPDGDTGDNMTRTIMGGIHAITDENAGIASVSRQAADGMILHARGNSGVILSQIFDGIAEGFRDLETAGSPQIDYAMECGVAHAYHAVIKPTEGTILTVAKSACEYAGRRSSSDPEEYLRDYVDEARRTLAQTPDMLSVLKEAGVVDSGGAGYVLIMEGILKAISGEISPSELSKGWTDDPELLSSAPQEEINPDLFTQDSVLEFGYCTEFLLRLQRAKTDPEHFALSQLTGALQEMGDSIAATQAGSLVRIHIHTMTPGSVFTLCQQYGEFLKVKVENMSLQHNHVLQKEQAAPREDRSAPKSYGVIAVCSGEGIRQLFLERGADQIVDGGQSSNPSASDFLEAFQKVNARTLLVFPNNGNIVLAARQAASLYDQADVHVVESRTIGEGLAALSMLDTRSEDTAQILQSLSEAMQGVVTAHISRCVRGMDYAGRCLHPGDFIGFADKKILAAAPTRLEAACRTMDLLLSHPHDICLIFCSADADRSESEKLESYIRSHDPGREVYRMDGMQEIYDYILILE
ncbi:MAG: DAK2 domain-containing protein [Candidatus Heritagella sp.]